MNIPPQTLQGVNDKILEITSKYKDLEKPSVDKTGQTLADTYQNIYVQLKHSLDEFGINLNVRNSFQTKYGVMYGREEEIFYQNVLPFREM